VTITWGLTSTLDFYLVPITPVGAIEIIFHARSLRFTNVVSIAAQSKFLHYAGSFLRYTYETPTVTVSNTHLFSIDAAPASTSPMTLELVHFIGTPAGGWYYGGWNRFASPARRITRTVNINQIREVCSPDNGCYWTRPEFAEASAFPQRIRTGASSQKVFCYGRMCDWELSQAVAVTPGKLYRFSVWVQGWQCNYNFERCCDGSGYCFSPSPANLNLRVGVDGQYTPPSECFDQWCRLERIALAATSTMTVSVAASVRFDWARLNNDVYMDDAALVECEKCVAHYLPLFSRSRE
jgi:hypothetical protein